MPTIVKFQASLLHYSGDPLGNDYFLHIVVRDTHHLAAHFRVKPTFNDYTDIRDKQIALQFDIPDDADRVVFPVAALAIETEPHMGSALWSEVSDFGHNAVVVDIDLREVLAFPLSQVLELEIPVKGDYLAARGREKSKTGLLKLLADITVERDVLQQDLSQSILSRFEAGSRNFTNAELQSLQLSDQSLPGINFAGSVLLWSNFDASDLYKASFKGANANEAIFTHANLQRANFDEAILAGTKFAGADASEAGFTKATVNAHFENAVLARAIFQDADIHAAKFNGANLEGATFSRAKLRYVDFRNANLKDVNFTAADIENINYDGANITGVIGLTAPSTNFDPTDPFEGKSQEYRDGFEAGYEDGYPWSSGDEVFDEAAWERSLRSEYENPSPDFAEGYQKGFMESYTEGFNTKGQ
jgi:uncharacterized protein YjbI with pentapeptide repeats